jgi:FHS family glucose/mannose:H+ symporter-like MFS transporter
MSLFVYVAYLSLFAMALVDNSRGNLLPLMQNDLKLSTLSLSFLFSGASLANFVFNFSYVRFKHLINLKWLYFWGLALIFISTIAFYYSLETNVLFFIGAFLFGLGAGCVGTLCNIFITHYCSPEKQPNALAFLHSMYGIASFLVPLIITALLKFLSWPSILIILGFPSLFLGFFILKLNPKIKVERGEHASFPWKYFWVSILFFLGADAELLTSSRLVDYLYNFRNFSFEKASFYLSLFFACLLSGRLLFSFIRPKISELNLMKISLILTIILNLLGSYADPICFSLSGFAMSWFFPIGMSWIKKAFASDYHSLLPMIMSFNSLSLLSLHFLVGKFVTQVSYHWIFLLPSCFCLLSLGMIYWKGTNKKAT